MIFSPIQAKNLRELEEMTEKLSASEPANADQWYSSIDWKLLWLLSVK